MPNLAQNEFLFINKIFERREAVMFDHNTGFLNTLTTYSQSNMERTHLTY